MSQILTISIQQVDPLAMVVTVPEAKDYLEVDFPLRDTDIERAIKSATSSLQRFTGLLFLPSTVSVSLAQNVVRGCENYVTIPYSNGAILTTPDMELKGDRIYSNESVVDVAFTGGSTEEWMKQGILKYVADLFIHRGDEGFNGNEAKQFCSQFISHGGFF